MNLRKRLILGIIFTVLFGLVCVPASMAQKGDYLSEVEADKIRDAADRSGKITLFLVFANDRLEKFKYELVHPRDEKRHNIELAAFLNQYASCVDDAGGQIEDGMQAQKDIGKSVKSALTKAGEFLGQLESLDKEIPESMVYKDQIGEAISATKEFIDTAKKSENKEGSLKRRKQS